MCGIAGYFMIQKLAKDTKLVRAALSIMDHRGPDDEGITIIEPSNGSAHDLITQNSDHGVKLTRQESHNSQNIAHQICLGHRRFSIIGLDPSGHQPLWDHKREICISVNGEIYNYKELRDELLQQGYQFQSTSDSEVIAVAYSAWGTKCFSRFNGFWALSLYDARSKKLLLARDRLGKAPLYYTQTQNGIFWASEIRSVFEMVDSSKININEQSVIDFATWHMRDYSHTTFYKEIQTLPNACYAWVGSNGELEKHSYWSLPDSRLKSQDISIEEASEEFRSIFDSSVKLRLQADVPVAVQLSGGMDSSAVLASAVSFSSKVSVFTIAFPDPKINEEPYAAQVVKHFEDKVDYTVIQAPDDDMLNNADEFISLMGEPFHSPNQFSTRQIWKTIADRGIKVNLSGSGGDEVLAGYSHFYFYPYLRSLIKQGKLGRFLTETSRFSERSAGPLGIDLLLRIAKTIPAVDSLHRKLFKSIPKSKDAFQMPTMGIQAWNGPENEINQRLKQLLSDHLLNYWLRIDNVNSMSIPLEIRLPMLDYRLVDFAFSLPLEYLIHDGWMKWILRLSMDDSLPKSITWRRKKMGFPFPLKEWLGNHKNRIIDMLQPLDCPYIDINKLIINWEYLRQKNPNKLWAYVSLAMWWKRCVQNESLN